MAACLASVLLWPGCSGSDDGSPPATVSLDGRTVETRELAGTVDGLCLARQQGATDVEAARATYEGRSRAGVEITARAMQGSYEPLASSVTEAAAAVEADLRAEPPAATLDQSLARLLETVRESLARLGVPTSACEK
ncbi:MAG TPA: hypothetical protein VHF91_07475 [Acidimicrobiales bacterium]|nr:hypothetical protein [Acidimicrobiales bacterium]